MMPKNMPDMRKIILESPSGKGEEWLSREQDIEWAGSVFERPAENSHLKPLNLERKEDPEIFIKKFQELSKNRAFVNYMESCTHCGICIDKCHYFIATGDVNNSPVGRAELARKMYKKKKRLKPKDVNLKKLYAYYYQCTECRRCSNFCPQGIDQAEITRTVRSALTEIGYMPDYQAATMSQVVRTGNNMGLNTKSIGSVVDFVKGEMQDETGKEIDIPLDRKKADFLLIPSSADLYVNLDTLKGYAKVMHMLKKDWTISTTAAEAANFGLFASEDYLRKFGDHVVDEAVNHGSKVVVWGECGHGWRAASNYVRYQLAEKGIQLIHVHQMTEAAMRRGDIKVDKNKNDDLYNYHDPCNLARGGNLVNEPREILSSVVRETVEAEYSKAETFCCGAGAGLLGDEKQWNDMRAWAGWPAAYYAWKTGASHMVSPCAIDKAQFPCVFSYRKVHMQTHGLMDLVGYAIEL